MTRKRIPLREVKRNANAAAIEARQLIAQSKGTVARVEVKTLEVLTNLLESVDAITDLIEDIQRNGIKGEIEIMGRKIPATVRVFPAGDDEEE
jgi:23S rRNA maturation-related 3'-5' exoribonuclease YhaM